MTVSLGVALAKSDESVIERADAAMYVAKRAGRDRISLSE